MAFSTLRPLRHRAFATVWSASIVSDIGTWMQLTVLGTLMAKTSDSLVSLGVVMAAQFIPSLVGAPIGGLLADRYDRRKIFMVALAAQTIITAVLAAVVATGERRAGILGLIVFFQGAALATGNSASMAMQPDLVPPAELLAAVSLGSASWNTGRIVGPALAFVIERLLGPTGALTANAVSFALFGIAVWSLRKPFMPHTIVEGRFFPEMRSGVQILWSIPGCRAAMHALLAWQFLFAPIIALMPAISRSLGGGQGLTSALSTSQGVGAVLGAAFVPILVNRIGRDGTFKIHWVVTALVVVGFGWITNTWAAIAAACLFGGAFTGVIVTFIAVMQRDAPAHARGRVLSVFQGCMGPLYGLGVALQAVVADRIGLLNVHRVFGALALAWFVGSVVLKWSGWRVLKPRSRPSSEIPA